MKITILQEKARQGLKRGVDLISNAVKVTLGPRGRNIIYGFHYGFPVATKDGVTVARQVESSDQLEQLGVLLIREVAQKTADDSGDGTTTAAVLAQAIFTEGLKSLNTGANPILIKRGIDNAVKKVVKYIDRNSKKIKGEEAILNVATLSANNDIDIGKLIKEAISQVGANGVVALEDNPSGDFSEVFTIEGMQLSEGMLSPFFITNLEKMIAVYENPRILIVDGEISDAVPLKPIIEEVIGTRQEPLLIIAHALTGTALQAMTMSKAKSNIPLLVCKAPQFGDYRSDMLCDVAIATGSCIVGGTLGIKTVDLTYDQLGRCRSVKADRFSCTIVGGQGDSKAIAGRISLLDEQIKASKSDYDKEKLQERLAKLTTGVAIVRVGAASELEQKEKKMRVEDSLHATKAAIEEGIVPGGGIVYLNASKSLKTPSKSSEEERIGYDIIRKALRAPILQIATNSGVPGEEIIANINTSGQGYNFLTNKYVDLVEDGVIDPTTVVKNALINAASVAGMMLTTEGVIYEREEDVVPPSRTPKPRSE